MKGNTKYLIISIILAFLLCFAQITGSAILILGVLAMYLLLIGWSCSQNATLLVLLFFLPWSQLLKTAPGSYSFYTFGMILVCAISVFKKQFRFKRYHIVIGVLTMLLTLLSKLMDGSALTFDYIAFIMLLVLFPVVKEEWNAYKYDYYQLVGFFCVGTIIAALCAQSFAGYSNIAQYIRVDSYAAVTRMAGFYGDPNFYTAQITAGLAGGLVLILRETEKRRIAFLIFLLVMMLYCGFLSGSKSFVLITMVILVLWLIKLLRMQGRTGLKLVMLASIVVVAIYVASSALFGDLVKVIVVRFSSAKDISDFTTGRTDVWVKYLKQILTDWKTLVFGNGYTNIKVDGRGSHNTLIQVWFQMGLLGIPLIVGWIRGFFKELTFQREKKPGDLLDILVLICGTFLPWLAIDILFFDEFFLLQMYVFLGIRQMLYHSQEVQDQTEANDNYPQPLAAHSMEERE